MNLKNYAKVRAAIAVFISALVSLSTVSDNFVLAAAAVITGLAFLLIAKSKAGIVTDERQKAVSEKAARIAYAVFAPTMAAISIITLLPGHAGLPLPKEWEQPIDLETLGSIFAYLTLFLIAIYAAAYHFINRKYGGSTDEE